MNNFERLPFEKNLRTELLFAEQKRKKNRYSKTSGDTNNVTQNKYLNVCKYLGIDPKDMVIHDLDSEDEELKSNQKLTNIPLETSINLHIEKQQLFESDGKMGCLFPFLPSIKYKTCNLNRYKTSEKLSNKFLS